MRLTQFRKAITMKNKRMKKNVSGYYVPSAFVKEMLKELTALNPTFEFTLGAGFILVYLSANDAEGSIPQGVSFAEYANTISELIPKNGQQPKRKEVVIPSPILKEILKTIEKLDGKNITATICRVRHDGDDK